MFKHKTLFTFFNFGVYLYSFPPAKSAGNQEGKEVKKNVDEGARMPHSSSPVSAKRSGSGMQL